MEWTEVRRFVCVGEVDDAAYDVVEYARPDTQVEINGRPAVLPGRRGFRLDDGRDLDPETGDDPQRFEIFETGQWLVRR